MPDHPQGPLDELDVGDLNLWPVVERLRICSPSAEVSGSSRRAIRLVRLIATLLQRLSRAKGGPARHRSRPGR